MTLETFAAVVGIASGLIAIGSALGSAGRVGLRRLGAAALLGAVVCVLLVGRAGSPSLDTAAAPVPLTQPWTATVGGVRCLALSPTGKLLVCATDESLTLWTTTGEQLRHLGDTPVSGITFAADERSLFLGSEDGAIGRVSLTGQRERTMTGHTGAVPVLVAHPDGRRLISGGWDGTVRVWDIESARERLRWDALGSYVACAALLPGGRHLVTGSGDGSVSLWDIGTGRRVVTFAGHVAAVRCLAVSPDGLRLATGSDDATARLWDMATGREVARLTDHTSAIRAVAVVGKDLFVVDAEGSLSNGQGVRKHLPEGISHAAFVPGQRCLIAGTERTLSAWAVGR